MVPFLKILLLEQRYEDGIKHYLTDKTIHAVSCIILVNSD